LRTTVAFSEVGDYTLRLTVTDGALVATDDILVTVKGDNPYLDWVQANFTAEEQQDPRVSGEDADPDGDQFSNQEEFIAGTHPRDPSSYLHVQRAFKERNNVVIRFEAIGDRGYSVQ